MNAVLLTIYMYLRNSRFVQGTQEDSHEALRCIFDAIKNEEIDVCTHVFSVNRTYCYNLAIEVIIKPSVCLVS